jgi:hypothetical protein
LDLFLVDLGPFIGVRRRLRMEDGGMGVSGRKCVGSSRGLRVPSEACRDWDGLGRSSLAELLGESVILLGFSAVSSPGLVHELGVLLFADAELLVTKLSSMETRRRVGLSTHINGVALL